MKYSTATLLLVGLISTSEAINQKTAWTGQWGEGDQGIIDALTPPAKDCEARLWEDPRELAW